MTVDVLGEICAAKLKSVAARKALVPLAQLRAEVDAQLSAQSGAPAENSFFATLANSQNEHKIIAEVKRASPSAGVIKADYDPLKIAGEFLNSGVTNLSVLTEERYFQGSLADLQRIKAQFNCPVLQKDFILDEYQIYEAKQHGADCILLIAEALSAAQLKALYNLANELGLDALVELHEEGELAKLGEFEDLSVVGINNRNLKTLATDTRHALELRDRNADYFDGKTIIAESGFSSRAELDFYVKNGISSFLIGESLLKGEM